MNKQVNKGGARVSASNTHSRGPSRCIALTLAACVLLAQVGCATVPQGQVQIQRGPQPALDQALAEVHKVLRRTLKNYDSLKDFSVQGELHAVTATNLGGNFEEAWMLCAEFNATNSYGGYTGIQPQAFPMRLDQAGKPFVVGTTNWVAYSPKQC